MSPHVRALLFVVAMVAGQLLFRAGATAATVAGTFLAIRPAVAILAAFAIYGLSSLVWISLLQEWPLSRAYPYAGLSFVLVPIAAHLLLGEPYVPKQMLGAALIAGGVVLAAAR